MADGGHGYVVRLSVREIQAHIGQRLCDAAHARPELASWRIGAMGLVS